MKKYLLLAICLGLGLPVAAVGDEYGELLELFGDWRAFERPPTLDGAPDYTAGTTARRHSELQTFRARLDAIDRAGWGIAQRVDWHLVRTEMNGMKFNLRVLRPWARDPAYYTSVWTFQSDTPDHEGPNHHAIIELWQYEFPLDASSEARLAAELRTIPPLLGQARSNLTGNARELWIGGIKNLRDQALALAELAQTTKQAGSGFRAALDAAQTATNDFVAWLEAEGAAKTGPSGIGAEAYTWSLQNVHLVPLTWEDEVRLLKRELDRALSSLKLEEHRNREQPAMRPISSSEEYEERAEASLVRFRDFLREQQVLRDHPWIEPALRAHMGRYVPPESRNFFWTVAHHEPLALWTHWYHWFDLGRMAAMPHPSPIRRGPLLYNIWDSRAEGMATAFEEFTMQAGLFDGQPRARELVWIMLAQRAARGLGSLEAQANRFTLKEARDFHVAWTPRGWMREDLDLLGFEQLLYLRQPGYGTSYITGKYLLERLMGERGRQLGAEFVLADFFEEMDAMGVIPVSLIRWQMTGEDDEIRRLMAAESLPLPALEPAP